MIQFDFKIKGETMVTVIDCYHDCFSSDASPKRILEAVVETARQSGCSEQIIARLQNEGGFIIRDLLHSAIYGHQLSRFKVVVEFQQDGWCELDFAEQRWLNKPPYKPDELLDGPWTETRTYWKKYGACMKRYFPIKKNIQECLDWIQYVYFNRPRPD